MLEYFAGDLMKIDNETVLKYMPLVKKIAKNIYFLNQNLELDDLISYGSFGLMDAIKKYENNKETKFETYASYRIRGAIIDGIRTEGKMKRNDVSLIKKIDKYKEIYENKYHRAPTLEELSNLLNINLNQLNRLIERIKISTAISIEELDDNLKYYDPKFDVVESFDLKKNIEDICSILTNRQKEFINLYYGYNLTEREIAAIFGITQTGVSQIKFKTLKKLRTEKNKEKLKDYL